MRSITNSYTIVKSLYRFAISNPWQLLTGVLYLQATVVKTLETPAALARYNQCSIKKPALFANTCAQEDELYKHYRIVTNVPSLSDVKHFLFANEHDNANQAEIRIHYFNTLVTPQDLLLFEGINFGTQILCSSFHDVDDNYHVSVELNNPNSRLRSDLYSLNNVRHYQLSDTLVCKGWDNTTLASATGEKLLPLLRTAKALTALIDEVIALSDVIEDTELRCQSAPFPIQSLRDVLAIYADELHDKIKVHTSLLYYTPALEAKRLAFTLTINKATVKNGHKFFATLKFIAMEFEKYLRDLHAEDMRKIKIIGDETIVSRNKVAINTFEFYRSFAGRTFSMFGQSHLRDEDHEPTYKDIQDIGKDDPAFELRQALDKHPHALLFPRR